MNNADLTPEVLFTNLVLDLSATAMYAMGKIANPETGETIKQMDMAYITIETLAMIKDKTKGNLNEKEDALLTTTLTNLRLTYVKEAESKTGA